MLHHPDLAQFITGGCLFNTIPQMPKNNRKPLVKNMLHQVTLKGGQLLIHDGTLPVSNTGKRLHLGVPEGLNQTT